MRRDVETSDNSTSSIETVDIIKNSRTLDSIPGREQLDVEISYSDLVTERETDYCYVHVTQVDGEQAWSSPIWVTTLPELRKKNSSPVT